MRRLRSGTETEPNKLYNERLSTSLEDEWPLLVFERVSRRVRAQKSLPPLETRPMSTSQRCANLILDETFLEVRAKLLEVAATLDRIDRSSDEGQPLDDASGKRRAKLDDAIRILLSEGPDRAERLQKLFSREYEPEWRTTMNL